MPHDFPVPDTERLESLLVQVFSAMQEAEPAHLNRLEERLVRRLPTGERQKKPNKIPWWIVLLLGGSVAVAGWYVTEWSGSSNDMGSRSTSLSNATGASGPGDDQPKELDRIIKKENTETQKQKDSPVIYQRGSY